MKTRFLRVFCLALALMLLSASALAADPDFRDYSQFPLCEDGSVKLTVMVPLNDTYGIPAEEMWFYNWWEYATGIDFEIEQISQSALKERKQIILASGELPDILWGFGFTPTELIRYGDNEGLLLDQTPYLTEEIMPNLSKFLVAYPETASCITTPAGGVYTLPYYRALFAGYSSAMYIDQNLLDSYGLEVPDTLDGFTAMLKKFKEENGDVVPLGGSASFLNPFYYILNAYGFIGQSATFGAKVAIRNGEAVIPAYDPIYLQALTTMKEYYDAGLISQDFFTLDDVTVKAQMAEGKIGVYGSMAYTVNPEYDFFSHWTAVKPLTSAENDTQAWLAAEAISIGGWVVSADTQYGELIARLADFFYSNIGVMYYKYGPAYGSSDALGMTNGVDYDPNNLFTTVFRRMDVELGVYANNNEYENKMVTGMLNIGNDAKDLETGMYLGNWWRTQLFGYKMDPSVDMSTKWFDPMHMDNNARISCNTNIWPYEVPGFPSIAYFSEEETDRIVELRSVIDPYIESEFAKFVTGARSLDEFEAFREELKALGIEELQGYYTTYYENLK